MGFPIGGQFEPTVYLAGFSDIKLQRYWGHDLNFSKLHMILGSRSWPFVVTWRHRSCDRWTRNVQFPIGGPLKPSLYLAWSHRCWDIMCQTLSQSHSHWKCIYPHFCLRDKIGGYSILQLCACSRSPGTSFKVLTATIGPRALLLRYLDLPFENTLQGWKLGQNRGRDHRILTQTKAFLLFRPQSSVLNFIKIEQKMQP